MLLPLVGDSYEGLIVGDNGNVMLVVVLRPAWKAQGGQAAPALSIISLLLITHLIIMVWRQFMWSCFFSEFFCLYLHSEFPSVCLLTGEGQLSMLGLQM